MKPLLKLLPFARGVRRLLLFTLALSLVGQVVSVFVPVLAGQMVRQAVVLHQVTGLPRLTALILALFALRGALNWTEIYLGSQAGQAISRRLREAVYTHLLQLRFSFFDRTRTGQLLSRLTSDLEPVNGFIRWGMRLAVKNLALLLFSFVMALRIDATLAWIGLGSLPMIAVTAWAVGARIRPAFERAREQLGVVTSRLQDNLQGIRVVKTYVQEEREIERFSRASDLLRDQSYEAARIDAIYYPLTGFWSGMAMIIVLYAGGIRVIAGTLSLDQYVTFSLLVMQLIVPMRFLGYMISVGQRAAAACARIFAILEDTRDVEPLPGLGEEGEKRRRGEGESGQQHNRSPAGQLQKAREAARTTRGDIGRVIVDLNFATETDVMKAKAEAAGIRFVDLATVQIDPSAINVVPAHLAMRHNVVPIVKDAQSLTVATANPQDVFAMDDLRLASGLKVLPVLASPDAIQQALGKHYSGGSTNGATWLPTPPLRGDVRCENVHFAYDGAEVLHGIDLDVRAGEVVGLVGTTGSGKSTLMSLIPAFYHATRGRVLVDGHDVSRLDPEGLRRQIGFVFQDPFLFPGTLRENLLFGRPEATEAEMVAAAKDAAIHDFILTLEKGYDTVIGERGLTLSGGQQQRLTIARTILMDPKILILDDYTSSVDTYTEHLIQTALARLMRGRTTFIITPRAAPLLDADRVIVMDEGRIVCEGPPHALASQPGNLFAQLLELQGSQQLAGAR